MACRGAGHVALAYEAAEPARVCAPRSVAALVHDHSVDWSSVTGVIVVLLVLALLATVHKVTKGGLLPAATHPEFDVEHEAAQLSAWVELAYSALHEYRDATAADWSGFDRELFARAQEQFESEGFVAIGDLLDDTLLRASPGSRHMMRVFIGDGGRTRTCVLQFHRSRMQRVLESLRIVRGVASTQCWSEIEGGIVVCTQSSKGGLSWPETVHLECMPVGTTIPSVISRHRERLTAHARSVFCVMTDRNDVLSSFQREHLELSRFRAGVGPLNADEMKAIYKQPLSDHQLAVLEAIQRGAKSGGAT